MKSLIIIFALLLLFLFGRIWFGQGSHTEIYRLQQQIDYQTEQNKQQTEINEKLRAEVDELKDEDDAVEEHARSELGMIKEGETFFQTILKPQSSSGTEAEQSTPVIK